MKAYIITAAFLLLCVIALDVVSRWIERFLAARRVKASGEQGQGQGQGQCKACTSIDPVSDPAYNMREIAKQSVLLEEHLTVPSKYCPDCCVKHLLHLHGLATEALMLACNDVDKYPMIKEAPDFYQQCMDDWLKGVRHADFMENPKPRLELATRLRNFRKKLINAYYIQT